MAHDSPIVHAAALTLDAGLNDRGAAKLMMRGRLVEALERCGGNVCRTAELLELHRNTLQRRLADLGLQELPATIRRQKREQLALKFSPRSERSEPGKVIERARTG